MIFDAIAGVLLGLVEGFLGLIPDWDLPHIGDASGFGAALATAGNIFPVGTLALCIGVLMATSVFVFGFRLVAWVWERLPFTFK